MIKIDDYEVFFSGSVISHDSKDVKFTFPVEENGDSLNFTFKVSTDNQPQAHFTTSVDKDRTGLTIEVFNICNMNYAGNAQLTQVATFSGRPLFLKFRVEPISSQNRSSDYILFYTWLLR
jgi:hypothetical protein